MRNATTFRLVVLGLSAILLSPLGCKPEDMGTVSTKRPDGGDGDGDGDVGDGDGDGDVVGDGDGDGDVSSNGHDGAAGSFTYDIVPPTEEEMDVLPLDLSNEGHVLLTGDSDQNIYDRLFIWDRSAVAPREVVLPEGSIFEENPINPALSIFGRLLSGDRVATTVKQGDAYVPCIIDGDTVEPLSSVLGASVGPDWELIDANDAGQFLFKVIGERKIWLLEKGKAPIEFQKDFVVGLTEEGVIGFSDGYWKDGVLYETAPAAGFFGNSGPSNKMTMLGGLIVEEGKRPVAIWDIEAGTVSPVPELTLMPNDGATAVLMLDNGNYIVSSNSGSPQSFRSFLYHDKRYEVLQFPVDGVDLRVFPAVANAQGNVIATSENPAYGMLVLTFK